MYRVGKNKKLALLTGEGLEVVVFNKGQEELAEKVCFLLNEDLNKEVGDRIGNFVCRPEQINLSLKNRGKDVRDIISINNTSESYIYRVFYKIT